MRYIGRILDLAREHTDNQDYEVDATTGVTTSGLSDNLLLEYANDAQDRLQSLIIGTYPQVFVEEEVISMSANDESYSISDNVFHNTRLISVEYSFSGSIRDYVTLDQRTLRNRVTTDSDHPSFYLRRGGEILLNPIYKGSNGTLRVNYYRELDNLDIRRGEVASITGAGTVASPLTAIVLEVNSGDTNRAPAPRVLDLETSEYVCVCDKDGTVQAYNIPVTSYTSGTQTIAVPSHVFGTGESIAAGDYITLGKYSTTHSDLSNNSERYIKAYLQRRIFSKDNSTEIDNEGTEMAMMEADILAAYADVSEDVMFPPILDPYIL